MSILPGVPETVKAVPPVTAGAAILASVPLATWVQIAALVWTLMLIIEKVPVIIQRCISLYNIIKKGVDYVRNR